MPVSPALADEIFWIMVWHFAALILSLVGNGLLYRHADKSPLLRSYLWLQATLLLWIVSKIFKTVSPNVDLRWFFIVTQYLGLSYLGPLFLNFATRFRFNRPPPRMLLIILFTLSSIFFILFATNPFHYLFYDTYDFWDDSFGPIFPFFMGYTYALILVSLIFSFGGIRKRRLIQLSSLIAVAAIIPLIVNVLYVTKIILPVFDVTPIVMTASIFFFGIAALRFNFFAPLPVARSILIETLGDALVITDRKGRVVHSQGFPLGQDLGNCVLEEELLLSGKSFKLSSSRLRDLAGFRLYTDVTELKRLSLALAAENALLHESIKEIGRRNDQRLFILEQECLQSSRRALHDILGHSLTLVIFLLRRALLDRERGLPLDEGALRQLVASHVSHGLEGLDRELSGHIDPLTVLSLALQGLVDECSSLDLDIELVAAGREYVLDEATVHLLRDACREAITNALRHGAASAVSLSLFWGRRTLHLNVCDNGRGCADPRPGNGLSLMAEALEKRGCTLSLNSEEGAGFQLSIALPL